MIEVMGNITVRPFSAYSVNDDGDVVVRSISKPTPPLGLPSWVGIRTGHSGWPTT
jgi:hypothetical protein